MKKLKYLILSLIVGSCLFVSCNVSSFYSVPDVDVQYGLMMNAYEGIFSSTELDSICKADTLNPDLNTWIVLPMKDYDTRENISQYIFIKSLGEHEAIYRVQKLSTGQYKITKRITR